MPRATTHGSSKRVPPCHLIEEAVAFTRKGKRAPSLLVARASRGIAVVSLRNPRAIENRDLSWRPARAARGSITVRVGGRQLVVRGRKGRFVISGRPGAQVVLLAGAARDPHGNTNKNRLRFRL